jgi:hypothetical protein
MKAHGAGPRAPAPMDNEMKNKDFAGGDDALPDQYADPEQPGKVPLFPELMARLDEIKTKRIGGLMIVRDWKDAKSGLPVAWPTGKTGDLTYLRHETKRLIRMAELPDNLSFSSFRHCGLTEGGDADMTDREILAQSAQKSPKVLPATSRRR